MYEKKWLILIKNKDKTNDVKSVQYNEGMWHVTFNTGKTYTYGYNNVEKLYDPEVVSTKNMELKISGEHVYNVYQILYFKGYAKLLFSNKSSRVCYKSDVRLNSIDKTRKSTDVFNYLKEVANLLKIKVDDDSSFLGNQFDSMIDINKQSILHQFVNQKYTRVQNDTDNIILPFGFNISQEKATRKAIYNKMSLIEGPPGTGKTQTILNIIANAIIKDKTIAIVSNNNSATVNVQEKLDEYGLSFISAFLGSRENKEKFLETQLGSYPDMEDWALPTSKLNTYYYTLKGALKELLLLNEKINQKSELTLQLKDVNTEYKHFTSEYTDIDYKDNKSLARLSSETILDLIEEIKTYKKATRFFKILFYFKYRVTYESVFFKSRENTIEELNNWYYINQIKRLKSRISDISRVLESNNFEDKKNNYQRMSMKFFKAVLHKKYKGKTIRRSYDSKDLYFRLDDFVKDYPVILSTTHSLRSISLNEYLYDYVVIDESSQVDIVSGALALSVANNAVIVGDSMQLPHVVNSEVKKMTTLVFSKYDIRECYKYTSSLLDSMKGLYKEHIASTLLREHYRCNPDIIGYCNKKFYNSELIIHTSGTEENTLSVYVSPEGNHARGNFNQRQIDIIVNEILPTIDQEYSIGIITPFREQANRLIEEFSECEIDADTVHKYQGRERDVIIISTVSNSIEANSFVDDKNLINVAVSRAKKKLVLVTSKDMLENKRTNVSDLVSYIKYNNYDVQESSILSVFDALYKRQSEKILLKYKNPRKVTEFKSENIVYELISEIFMEDNYSTLSVLLHYPLRKIIKEYNLLSEKEKRYASNYLTHVDFLIYNKLSKQPALVIEVDGYAYHNKNEIQLKRDRMKDNILRKYNVKILRLNTTGSNEKSRIMEML